MASCRVFGLVVCCALMLASAPAGAAAQKNAEIPVLTVTTAGNPVDKSYRRMVQGMEHFERRHALAPAAALRFKVLPRRNDVDPNRVSVEIVSDTLAVPVALAPDSTFTLERIAKAWEEDASVQLNRKALTMTWRAEIRTPGVPAGMRRLGDLRLECEVGMEAGLISNVPSAPGPEHCSEAKPRYFFFAERPLFSVSLVAGSRRQTLPLEMMYANTVDRPMSRRELARCDCEVLLDRAYTLPLGDTGWPDDTLVEYEYMDERPSTSRVAAVAVPAAMDAFGTVAVGRSTRRDVIEALGRAPTIRFESGFEVWAYRFGEPGARRGSRPETELAILFAPSGVATKIRLGDAATEVN